MDQEQSERAAKESYKVSWAMMAQFYAAYPNLTRAIKASSDQLALLKALTEDHLVEYMSQGGRVFNTDGTPYDPELGLKGQQAI